MTGKDNEDVKWSENKIEEEDSLRTVDCLRGRLLAERVASRNAREEAEQLGNKVLELENKLKEEAKSRNRAEKKLKFLIKRLQSMNISCEPGKSRKSENLQMELSVMCGNQEFKEDVKSQKPCANSRENDSQHSLWSLSHDSFPTEGSSTSSNENPISSAAEDCLSCAGERHSEKANELNHPNQMSNDSTTDEQRDFEDGRTESSSEGEGGGLNQEEDQDRDKHVDSSMALVQVETAEENERIDPEAIDATVKEVLESLRRAKEQLQISMERRRVRVEH